MPALVWGITLLASGLAAGRRLVLLMLCLALALQSTTWAGKPVPTKTDIPFGPHPHQLLDLYLPPKGEGPFPVVIWFGGPRNAASPATSNSPAILPRNMLTSGTSS